MTDHNPNDNELTTGPERELERRLPANESPVHNVSAWLLTLAGIALLVILWGNFRTADAESTVAAAGVQAIHVAAGSTRVEVLQGGTGQVELELSGRGGNRRLDVHQGNGALDVRVLGTWWLPGWFGFGRSVLTITVPAGMEPDLHLRSSSGRMNLEGVSLADVTVRTASGRLCLQDLQVSGNLQVNSSSGRICLQDSVVSGSASIQVSSGRVEVTDSSAADFQFASSSGRIEASGLPGSPLTASTSSGRLDLAADTILGDWNLQSSSGRVTVSLGQVPADLGLDFRGSSGSWSVADRYGLDLQGANRNQLQASIGSGRPVLQVRTSSGGFSLE